MPQSPFDMISRPEPTWQEQLQERLQNAPPPEPQAPPQYELPQIAYEVLKQGVEARMQNWRMGETNADIDPSAVDAAVTTAYNSNLGQSGDAPMPSNKYSQEQVNQGGYVQDLANKYETGVASPERGIDPEVLEAIQQLLREQHQPTVGPQESYSADPYQAWDEKQTAAKQAAQRLKDRETPYSSGIIDA